MRQHKSDKPKYNDVVDFDADLYFDDTKKETKIYVIDRYHKYFVSDAAFDYYKSKNGLIFPKIKPKNPKINILSCDMVFLSQT